MDFFTKYRRQITTHFVVFLLLQNGLLLGLGWLLHGAMRAEWLFGTLAITAVLSVPLFVVFLSRDVTEPTRAIWYAVQHLMPGSHEELAPARRRTRTGRELVSRLSSQIYQLATTGANAAETASKRTYDLHSNFIANALPLPLVVLDSNNVVVYANEAAADYFHDTAADLLRQSLVTALPMSFENTDTLMEWIDHTKKHKVTDSRYWERVRIGLPGQKDGKLFDLAAHYNKDNPAGYETMLVFVDRSELYGQDDQTMGFVALTVHELRTPVTLLRGYIEVFDEELAGTLDDEMRLFMKKMIASSQRLASFIDNILNVARIEDNQLTLQLHEENWEEIVVSAIQDLSLQADVRGVRLHVDVAPDLPTVGVDRASIYEVLANLVDNAIKYSTDSHDVYITAKLGDQGVIETSVQDHGRGISETTLPHVFDKFYRDHRNRSQVGGTGLGLYLCRAVVTAHGGRIWVRSKVGQGSTFSFTVLPYATLAAEGKTGNTNGITRGVHGWIKNHSFYEG